jgi:Zn-dependent alcohol dehydrogenase
MRSTGTLLDGTSRIEIGGEPGFHFLGVSCFAQHAVVPESALLAIPPDIPMPVAAIASCSVLTGFGAVLNAGGMSAGDTVAVIGAGGVGIAAVATAALAGATRVVVIEPNVHRRAFAAAFGATDLIDSHEVGSGHDVVRLLGEAVDIAIEAAGDPGAIRLASDMLRPGGTAVLVGGHVAGADGTFRARDLIVDEKTIVGSIFGSSRPAADFRRIFDLYRAGRLPLDRMLGPSFPLKRINDAYAQLLSGQSNGRLVIALS